MSSLRREYSRMPATDPCPSSTIAGENKPWWLSIAVHAADTLTVDWKKRIRATCATWPHPSRNESTGPMEKVIAQASTVTRSGTTQICGACGSWCREKKRIPPTSSTIPMTTAALVYQRTARCSRDASRKWAASFPVMLPSA